MHQIGVLPILIYAEEHNELLADPVSLNHVIERIHPVIGDKLLAVWEFPEMLLKLPGQYQDVGRESKAIDYIDLVQIATVFCEQRDTPTLSHNLNALHAFKRLKLDADSEVFQQQMNDARGMFM